MSRGSHARRRRLGPRSRLRRLGTLLTVILTIGLATASWTYLTSTDTGVDTFTATGPAVRPTVRPATRPTPADSSTLPSGAAPGATPADSSLPPIGATTNPVSTSGATSGKPIAGSPPAVENVNITRATPPVVSAIDRQSAANNPTNSPTVSWTVTFSEAVLNVGAGNFSLTATGSLTGFGNVTVTGSDTTWIVTADTGTGSGALRLDLSSIGTIIDSAGTPLSTTHPGDQTFTIYRVAPVVLSITRGASPTNAGTVSWTVTFSENVNQVAAANFSLAVSGLSGPSITSVSGSGTTWTVTASTGTGSGTLGLDLDSNLSNIVNDGGTALDAPFTGDTYTIRPFVPVAVALRNGNGTPGRADQGDTIVASFSQAIHVSSMCSGWTVDGLPYLVFLTNAVTVTLHDGGPGNDYLTVGVSGCSNPRFNFGSIDLGSTMYTTAGDITFGGTGTNASTLLLNPGDKVVTITLGRPSSIVGLGTVPSSQANYTPDPAIMNTTAPALSVAGSVTTGVVALL